MDEFLPNQLTHFLIETDRHLDRRCELIIVGGAAASIAYSANRTTTDIDTQNKLSEALENAFERARKETGFLVPVSYVGGVCEGPYDYEDRLEPFFHENFKNLLIYVPEHHDLALMKIVRGNENDVQGITDIQKNHPFDFDILTNRFKNDMTHVIGHPRMLKLNFLDAISNLFGDDAAEKANEILKDWRRDELIEIKPTKS